MMIIGLFLIVGGLTGAYLFNWNVERWNDRISAVIRNAFAVLCGIGMALMVKGCVDHIGMPVYEYKIKAHYIDGSTRTICYEGIYNPEITTSQGAYYLHYGGFYEPGIVRFDILDKRKK